MTMSTVREYMKEVVTVQDNQSVMKALELMLSKQKRIVAVVAPNNRIRGVVTYTDILKLLATEIKHSKILTGNIDQIMKDYTRFVFTETSNSMLDALKMMVDENVRNLVVIEGLEPVGMINQEIMLDWWLKEVVNAKES
jgi:predicted transcriptional regulator